MDMLAATRDIAVVILFMQVVVVTLIQGVLLFFAVRGMRAALRWLRGIGFPQAQRYARLMSSGTNRYSAKIAEPIIRTETGLYRARATQQAIFDAFTRPRKN